MTTCAPCCYNSFIECRRSCMRLRLCLFAFRQVAPMVARDIMKTEVVSLLGTDTARRAGEVMLESGYSALPVIDESGILLGVFGESDILALTLPEYLSTVDLSFLPKSISFPMPGGQDLDSVQVASVLRPQMLRAVPPDEPVVEVARIMVREHVRRCFVVEDRKLVGIISRRDLMQIIVRPTIEANGSEEA